MRPERSSPLRDGILAGHVLVGRPERGRSRGTRGNFEKLVQNSPQVTRTVGYNRSSSCRAQEIESVVGEGRRKLQFLPDGVVALALLQQVFDIEDEIDESDLVLAVASHVQDAVRFHIGMGRLQD